MEKSIISFLVTTFVTIYIIQLVAKALKSERPSFGYVSIVVITNSIFLFVSSFFFKNQIILILFNILVLWPLAKYLLRSNWGFSLLLSITSNVISMVLSATFFYLYYLR